MAEGVIEGVDEARAYADQQLAAELGARETIARAAGVALIELSAVLESGDAVVDRAVDPLGVILLAFAARGRRLLRSAYRLIDHGEGSEAVPLLRIISEYVIVGRWLTENQEKLGAWAIADIDKRAFVLSKVIDEIRDELPDVVEALESQEADLARVREQWVKQQGEPTESIVNLEQMADAVGLGFAYQLGYRTQSQYNVHATPLAVDACYDVIEGEKLRLRAAPQYALEGYNQYELGAHTLRDLLATVASHIPSLLWASGLTGITASLESLRENDPRKSEDPTAAVRAAADG